MPAERLIDKMQLSDRELLVHILTKTESIDERLQDGGKDIAELEARTAAHETMLIKLTDRVRDMDGNDDLPSFNTMQVQVRELAGKNGRPSFAAMQNDHIRIKILFWAAAAMWSGMIGLALTIGTWLGVYHPK